MPTAMTIQRQPGDGPAFDHRQLYQLGLEHIQKLSGRVWTDYNVHDPGVTILELLCYALTDLSYRASFPLEDLLASETDNAGNMAGQFFTARQILPNRPVTEIDYRKLLIDLPGVTNAWLRPATVTYWADPRAGQLAWQNPGQPGVRPIKLGGLYDVLVDLDTTDEPAVLAKVAATLQANRNLCEDFVSIRKVETQPFMLCCEIELKPQTEATTAMAGVFLAVQESLAPLVRNYSLSEMLARPKADGTARSAADLFNGPRLECGFIDEEQLAEAELKTEIRLSDIISVIMDVEGVLAVKNIVLNPTGTTAGLDNKWRVPVAARRKATLDAPNSRVVFYKQGVPVVADRTAALAAFTQGMTDAVAKTEQATAYDLPIPRGRFRRPATYTSFQNHFPAIYGIGEDGLHSVADDHRKAQACQLKAYLLFFDQLFADYLAQLAGVKSLFSTDPAVERTYFAQVVDSFKSYQKIYANGVTTPTLMDLVEDSAVATDRRNRFLDHLIARFAEQFTAFGQVMYSTFGFDGRSLAWFKCDFLRSYPTISGERGRAYNARPPLAADLWDSANVSGLEQRLGKLLGLQVITRRNLFKVSYDSHAVIESSGGPFTFRITDAADAARTLLHSSDGFATAELAQQALTRALYFALLPAGYRKVVAAGRFSFVVADTANVVLALPPADRDFADEAARDRAIADLICTLLARYSDDGMYLVENILLRPTQATDAFLPICSDPNCTDCEDDDPYTYRLHFILPAYSSRFSNVDFRRFAEQVIRAETPAHILPKICWISQTDMERFELAYRAWLFLYAGFDATQRKEKWQELVQALGEVKNVYYPQELADCRADRPKFVLDRTALGTLKNAGD